MKCNVVLQSFSWRVVFGSCFAARIVIVCGSSLGVPAYSKVSVSPDLIVAASGEDGERRPEPLAHVTPSPRWWLQAPLRSRAEP
jgi:hypothetical protein